MSAKRNENITEMRIFKNSSALSKVDLEEPDNNWNGIDKRKCIEEYFY